MADDKQQVFATAPPRRAVVAIAVSPSGRSGDGALRFCCGDHLLDLLLCAPMLISGLVMLGILWHAVRTLPGFLESVGYVFGILLASFMLDAGFQRHED